MANNLVEKETELIKELALLAKKWGELQESGKKISDSIKLVQTRKFEIDTQLKLIAEQKTWVAKPKKK